MQRKKNPNLDEAAFQRKGLLVSKLSMFLIFALAIIVVLQGEDVAALWVTLFNLTAGLGFVYILRWFWYRINATCEIGAMLTSLLLYGIAYLLKQQPTADASYFAELAALFGAESSIGTFQFMFITLGSVVVVIVTALFTEPDSQTKRETFLTKVKPPFWFGPESVQGERGLWLKAVLALAIVFGLLLFMYELLFGQFLTGPTYMYIYGGIFLASAILYRNLAEMKKARTNGNE